MFGHNRQQLRQHFQQCWQKFEQQQPLSALEQQIVTVLTEHPEYHVVMLSEQMQDKDWLPENGETNPFLHCGMHLAIREQVATNRPVGIQAIYQRLVSQHQDAHQAEHAIMDCLAEAIWQAQRYNVMPDEAAYLRCLQGLSNQQD